MKVVACILLIIIVLGLFIYGYYLMGRIDSFLIENRKHISKNAHPSIFPVCIDGSEEISEEELAKESKKYIKEHKNSNENDEIIDISDSK
jgi:hypothetical protein